MSNKEIPLGAPILADIANLQANLATLQTSFDTLKTRYDNLIFDMTKRDLSNRVDKLETEIMAIQQTIG